MSKEKLSLDIDTLLDNFKLSYNYSCNHLSEWMQVSGGDLTPLHQELLSSVYEKMKLNGDFWNEEELKINVIGFVMYLADIDVEGKIKTFFERSLSSSFGDKEIAVKCDCMVATPKGKGTPKAPYFFLQVAPSRPSPKGKENFYKVKKRPRRSDTRRNAHRTRAKPR